MRLPVMSRFPVEGDAEAMVAALDRYLRDPATATGFMVAELGGRSLFLFCLKGQTHSAGEAEGTRLSALPIEDFFQRLDGATRAHFVVTDLPLFLCTSVIFRKAPSAQIPSEILDGDTLLKHVRQTGKDAVVVVRRRDARNLVFCRGGEPVALYPAEGEEIAGSGDIADRILGYVYAEQGAIGDTTLDLYDQIAVGPAPGAGKAVWDYTIGGGGPDEEALTLVVRLGGRTVFHYPVRKAEITVGRGADNDLQLDNLSVSRNHARIRKHGDSLIVEDLGSQNGLKQAGKKIGTARLQPGDEVDLGRYTLVYPHYAPTSDQLVEAPKRRAAAEDPTMAISQKMVRPPVILTDDGERHLIRGLLFTMGKQPSANIRLSGLMVAPVHVRIRREADGSYSAEHVAGGRKLSINGVATKRATLKSGDELEVAGRRFRYTQD